MSSRARLVEILRAALDVGFLGTADVDAHIRHAEGFGDVIEAVHGAAPETMCDLGSGGGVPALVLLDRWPRTRAVLIESASRRAAFLQSSVAELGWDPRVTVAADRAENVAHDPQYREAFDVVTARGFGEPAVTGEIAAGLVRVGGLLVVSEPPYEDEARWPATGVASLGFGPAVRHHAREAHYVVLEKLEGVGPDVPRGVGRPAKRPRW